MFRTLHLLSVNTIQLRLWCVSKDVREEVRGPDLQGHGLFILHGVLKLSVAHSVWQLGEPSRFRTRSIQAAKKAIKDWELTYWYFPEVSSLVTGSLEASHASIAIGSTYLDLKKKKKHLSSFSNVILPPNHLVLVKMNILEPHSQRLAHDSLGLGSGNYLLPSTPGSLDQVVCGPHFLKCCPKVFHVPQLSNHCVRCYNSIYFQRKRSGTSFSFSSHIQAVISFCHNVPTFSLCLHPLLKLLTPNHHLRSRHLSQLPPRVNSWEVHSVIWATTFLDLDDCISAQLARCAKVMTKSRVLWRVFFLIWISCQYFQKGEISHTHPYFCLFLKYQRIWPLWPVFLRIIVSWGWGEAVPLRHRIEVHISQR